MSEPDIDQQIAAVRAALSRMEHAVDVAIDRPALDRGEAVAAPDPDLMARWVGDIEAMKAALATLERCRWRPIADAPKDGRSILLWIPYDQSRFAASECADIGHWSERAQCFRFSGDDGPQDIQPTHFKPLDDAPPAAPEHRSPRCRSP